MEKRESLAFVLVVLIIALLPAAYAERPDTLLKASSMDSTITIQGSLTLISQSSSAIVEKAVAHLFLIPEESPSQSVPSVATEPSATISAGMAEYAWTTPPIGKLPFNLIADVQTRVDEPKVTQKVEYPLQILPAEFVPYTQATQDIDVTPEISSLAKQLRGDKSDLYEIEYTLASWVKGNIRYDLKSLGADSTQKSSWVLQNRNGVCDELTSLFISLNRALGIPARFMSGVAYTNLEEFPDPWVAHAWAEVYFPGYGWVPFDISYGEFGSLDPGHITLQASADSSDPSANYAVTGRRIDFQTGNISTDVVVHSQGGAYDPGVLLSLSVFKDKVRFGSSDVITATLENEHAYYQIVELTIAQTTHLTRDSPDSTMVLLRPHEKKQIPFLVTVDSNLQQGYKYTFPLTAYIPGANETIEFEAFEQGAFYAPSDLQSLLQQEAVVPQQMALACTVGAINRQAPASITCALKSKVAGRVNLCLQGIKTGDCQSVLVDAQEASQDSAKEVQFTTPALGQGVYSFKITAQHESANQERASDVVVIAVPDIPSLLIENLDAPQILDYNQSGSISFTVAMNSSSTPLHSRIQIIHSYINQSWDLDDASVPHVFSLQLQGSNLESGDNKFTIIVTYQDESGTLYNVERAIDISLGKTTFPEKILVWLNAFGHWLNGVFTFS